MSVVARGREGVTTFDRDYRWDDEDDHATASGGAVAGGLTGLLIGAGVALIPGVGPIFAAGPIAATVGALMGGAAGAAIGGAAGAAIGGVAGGLIQAGVPEEEARYYEDRFREGGYLVTVTTSREDLARSVLARNGAHIRGYEGASIWQPRTTAANMYEPRSTTADAVVGTTARTTHTNPPHGQPGHVHTPGDNAGGTATGAVTGGLVGAAAGGALAGAAAGGVSKCVPCEFDRSTASGSQEPSGTILASILA